MSSGNFIIGKYSGMNEFNKYVKPKLERYKAQVTDIFHCIEENNNGLLISLIGDANPEALEQTLRVSLEEASNFYDKDYEVIGLYQDNQTASKIFQNLAVEHSLNSLESKISDVEDSIRAFKEKFKDFK